MSRPAGLLAAAAFSIWTSAPFSVSSEWAVRSRSCFNLWAFVGAHQARRVFVSVFVQLQEA
eukprot:4893664-Alexandrium_andersonii.AAC.1